jgi:hypothetical protein
MGKRKNFSENYRKFEHVLLKRFASHALVFSRFRYQAKPARPNTAEPSQNSLQNISLLKEKETGAIKILK